MSAFDNTETTPMFIDTINTIVDKHLFEINTSTPAKIISYDHGKNLAVVQPTLCGQSRVFLRRNTGKVHARLHPALLPAGSVFS